MKISDELQRAGQSLLATINDAALVQKLEAITDCCVRALGNGNKILFAGNGGSAADAQHLAAELVGRFYFERAGLPAIALNTDTSMLTAIGNDYGFEHVFARQIQANGRKGDVLFAFSTSGASANILKAIATCRDMGITTVGLTGSKGEKMAALCDHAVLVPDTSTPRIQEAHTVIGHVICAGIEDRMFRR